MNFWYIIGDIYALSYAVHNEGPYLLTFHAELYLNYTHYLPKTKKKIIKFKKK